MANVLLLTTAGQSGKPYATRDFERLTAAAAADRFGAHQLTEDPEKADVILYVGVAALDMRDVRCHEYGRGYRSKCFVFDSSDRVIPFYPGVYACAERGWFPRRWARAGFYLRVFENALAYQPTIPPESCLWSFVGNARNARIRQKIVALRDPRSFVFDTSGERVAQTDAAHGANSERWARYADVLCRSRFVLCPRGQGVSTWRLFEAMKVGRAPVILSDRWIRPDGPDWDSFSLTVREREVDRIPAILARHEADAAAMGLRARQAWEDWFSRDVTFHHVVESCLDIASSWRGFEWTFRVAAFGQLFRPFFFRHAVLSRIARKLPVLRR